MYVLVCSKFDAPGGFDFCRNFGLKIEGYFLVNVGIGLSITGLLVNPFVKMCTIAASGRTTGRSRVTVNLANRLRTVFNTATFFVNDDSDC